MTGIISHSPNRVLLSSGIINNSSPVLPAVIQLKEDLDQLEERLTSVHELMIESESKRADEEAETSKSSHNANQGTGNGELRTELIQLFNGMKERLKSVCDAIQLPLSEDVLNCEISFGDGKVTSRPVTSTQTLRKDKTADH